MTKDILIGFQKTLDLQAIDERSKSYMANHNAIARVMDSYAGRTAWAANVIYTEPPTLELWQPTDEYNASLN